MSRTLLSISAIAIFALLSFQPSQAQIIDPTNDFIPSYLGPHAGDVDVVSADGVLNGNNFVFSATMNAPLFTTPNSLYVWGINRGNGTAGFAAIAPGVLFNSVVVVNLNNVNGPGTYTVTSNGTVLSASNAVISGSDITVTVPTSTLPSTGFALSQYTWNLWPRNTTGGLTGTAPISDFAPNNSNVTIRVVPEPSTFALLGASGFSLLHFARRRTRKESKSA